MARLKNHPEHWLRDDAAAQFDLLEDHHGIFTVNSAGRTEAEQQALIDRWDRGGTANRPPYLYEPARPASSSNHVANGGIAVDTPDISRMLNAGQPYGFYRPYTWDEVHFEFDPARVSIHATQPNQEDEMTIEDIYVPFSRTTRQVVAAGSKPNLWINDLEHVTVARDTAKHVSGNLSITITGGTPGDNFKVFPIVWDPDTFAEVSLGSQEVFFTGGSTYAKVPVNTGLTGNQRLKFRIGGASVDFTVASAAFRGAKFN